jgi:hypothetical protein
MAGKKNRKHNRHKTRSPSAKAYAAEGRYENNARKRQAKHALKHVNDKQKLGVAADYKIKKLLPKEQLQLERDRVWKTYLRGEA